MIILSFLIPNLEISAKVLTPTSPMTKTLGNDKVVLDISNVDSGYFTITYKGKNSKIKVQIKKNGGTTYTYDLTSKSTFEVFPISEGNGSYSVKVFENVSGSKYAQAFSETVDVKLKNEFTPFLYPNQYVNFTAKSQVVKTANKVCKNLKTDIKKVDAVFNYVVDNLKYDYDKAKNVQSGYLPNVDKVLKDKKGICFDYAAVMASMLRSQDIPTRLVIGYTGEQYHAWIDVYLEEVGWVASAIYFDGQDWSIMDPTFASTGNKGKKVMKYITTPANYKGKFAY